MRSELKNTFSVPGASGCSSDRAVQYPSLDFQDTPVTYTVSEDRMGDERFHSSREGVDYGRRGTAAGLAVSSLAEKLNYQWITAVLRLDRIVSQGEAGLAEFFEQCV